MTIQEIILTAITVGLVVLYCFVHIYDAREKKIKSQYLREETDTLLRENDFLKHKVKELQNIIDKINKENEKGN